MKLIQARFIGNNSLGYVQGRTYLLIFKERGFWERFFDTWSHHKIEIWRANSKNIDVKNMTYRGLTGFCIYTNMTTFLYNWSIEPQVKLVELLPDIINQEVKIDPIKT